MTVCMKHSDDKLIEVFNREFKWNAPIQISHENGDNYKFMMCFVDYANNMPSSEYPGWKLINRILHMGYVYFNKYELIRVIAQVLINELKHRSKDYSENIDTHELEKKEPITINEGAFPPCIKRLIIKADNGIFLGHHERLLLANFLNIIKYTIDDVISVFQFQPDFKIGTTQYFVNYSRKNRSKPYNCDKIRTLGGGICNTDSYCKKYEPKNPLGYYSKLRYNKSIPKIERAVKNLPHFRRIKRPETEE